VEGEVGFPEGQDPCYTNLKGDIFCVSSDGSFPYHCGDIFNADGYSESWLKGTQCNVEAVCNAASDEAAGLAVNACSKQAECPAYVNVGIKKTSFCSLFGGYSEPFYSYSTCTVKYYGKCVPLVP
jgi:hypothetical protein